MLRHRPIFISDKKAFLFSLPQREKLPDFFFLKGKSQHPFFGGEK